MWSAPRNNPMVGVCVVLMIIAVVGNVYVVVRNWGSVGPVKTVIVTPGDVERSLSSFTVRGIVAEDARNHSGQTLYNESEKTNLTSDERNANGDTASEKTSLTTDVRTINGDTASEKKGLTFGINGDTEPEKIGLTSDARSINEQTATTRLTTHARSINGPSATVKTDLTSDVLSVNRQTAIEKTADVKKHMFSLHIATDSTIAVLNPTPQDPYIGRTYRDDLPEPYFFYSDSSWPSPGNPVSIRSNIAALFPSDREDKLLLESPPQTEQYLFTPFDDVYSDKSIDVLKLLDQWNDLSRPFLSFSVKRPTLEPLSQHFPM